VVLAFPRGYKKKIFERFYSERPKNETFGNHSGLGLFISKQIIDAHGGSIEAYNLYNDKKICIGGGIKTILKIV
jgi:two-component system sensor histidine kinase ChvG